MLQQIVFFAFQTLISDMHLLVNQISIFVLFDYIIRCEFFAILNKTTQNILNSGGWVVFPKWGEKTD